MAHRHSRLSAWVINFSRLLEATLRASLYCFLECFLYLKRVTQVLSLIQTSVLALLIKHLISCSCVFGVMVASSLIRPSLSLAGWSYDLTLMVACCPGEEEGSHLLSFGGKPSVSLSCISNVLALDWSRQVTPIGSEGSEASQVLCHDLSFHQLGPDFDITVLPWLSSTEWSSKFSSY